MKTPTLILILGLALTSNSFAVDPPPDGGYAGDNTAEGEDALFSLTTGIENTAVGFDSLFNNTSGDENTALGMNSLLNNTIGSGNTALGLSALSANTSGSDNIATGGSALAVNTTGSENVAIGSFALFSNTSGSNNIALGPLAGLNLTIGSSNIDIGSAGVAGESKTIRIGITGTQRATYIAGISGAPVANGVDVMIDSTGRLGTRVSSQRFKERVQPMAKSSEAILALKPVTFRYKKELDPKAIPQFGLVAEDVAEVDPDLVAKDDQGKPYTVRYEAVNAMLLNEFLKERKRAEEQAKKVEEQASEIADLKSALRDVNARLTAKGL